VLGSIDSYTWTICSPYAAIYRLYVARMQLYIYIYLERVDKVYDVVDECLGYVTQGSTQHKPEVVGNAEPEAANLLLVTQHAIGVYHDMYIDYPTGAPTINCLI
jgi:hypothetical protein